MTDLPAPLLRTCEHCGAHMEPRWDTQGDGFWECLSCGSTVDTYERHIKRFGEDG